MKNKTKILFSILALIFMLSNCAGFINGEKEDEDTTQNTANSKYSSMSLHLGEYEYNMDVEGIDEFSVVVSISDSYQNFYFEGYTNGDIHYWSASDVFYGGWTSRYDTFTVFHGETNGNIRTNTSSGMVIKIYFYPKSLKMKISEIL